MNEYYKLYEEFGEEKNKKKEINDEFIDKLPSYSK
jgi:hypothetical protein